MQLLIHAIQAFENTFGMFSNRIGTALKRFEFVYHLYTHMQLPIHAIQAFENTFGIQDLWCWAV